MKKYPKFIFNGFEVEQEGKNLRILFDFQIPPDIHFRPEITFPHVKWEAKLNNLVFNLGMVEMLSYWKATCSPQIIIKAGFLDENQIKFWKKLLIKGLGEFFYQNQAKLVSSGNKIDFTQKSLVEFVVESNRKFSSFEGQLKEKNLILTSGGKDSAVTLENFQDKNSLMLNPSDAAKSIAKIASCKNPIIIKRKIDPKLLELNKKGYFNGHTPFSAYLAFLSTLAACLYNYKNIIVSHEASANEGNVEYLGEVINHQYSKTQEFENDFKKYAKKYLAPVNYFSFLRDFNELEIARMFARLEKYHQIFRSCNRGSKQNRWCGKCPKCLFICLILYPPLGEKVEEIFGRDLLNDETLSPLMEELLQLPGKFKPFECVGTKPEITYAMLLGVLKNPKKLLKKYQDKISVLILGMGREGQTTRQFLKKYNIKFGTCDQKDGKNYLDKLKDYDIIIKSPGIPYLPEIQKAKLVGKIITSATQIFFDLCQGKIIGVTGTKGKSTTTAMIYEVLKAGGLDAYLVGNIGTPALEILNKINKNSVVAYELSSFQLTDLKSSPQVAVTTNIYADHLDWHGSLKNYQKAKENITKYQTKHDVAIQNKSGAMAARIVGKFFKIPAKKINKAIKNFKPLPHRLEFVGEFKGIRFYNDSLATNPYAAIFALKKLGDSIETLIAGGYDRGADYTNFSKEINKSKIKNLILFPDTGARIAKEVSSRIKKFNADSMEKAVKLAFTKTSPGKICLLSPASASFNMFKNYEDRGDQFKNCLASLSISPAPMKKMMSSFGK